jgi:probable O-glycosylation ligase (exosortase A-associated)
MRDLIITLIVFGAIPVIIMRPYIGVLVWSWLGYMNPHRLAYGFAYNFPFAQITAIALLIGLLVSKEPKKIPITPLTLIWIIFIVWMCITTPFAMFPEFANDYLIRVLKMQLPIFITIMLFYSKERLDALIWIIFISIGYYGIKGGIFTIATGGSARVWGPPNSFIEGNNELALATLMVIPLVSYLHHVSSNIWLKRFLIVAMLLMAVSAIGSQSRGALLAGLAVLTLFWLKSNKKIVTAVVSISLAVGIFMFMPQSWHDRMSTIETYEEDDSAMGRITAWKMATNLAAHRILGGGFETFRRGAYDLYLPEAPLPLDAHSIYFKVLGEQGFIGLILFLTILALAFRTAKKVEKVTNSINELEWLNYLSRMVRISLIAFIVGGAFLGLTYYDLPYHLFAILVIANELAKQVQQKYVLVKS